MLKGVLEYFSLSLNETRARNQNTCEGMLGIAEHAGSFSSLLIEKCLGTVV